MGTLRDGDSLEYLSPQECAVILRHNEADALLALLEQAVNAGMDPGVGLRVSAAEEAGFKIVQQRFADQDPFERKGRLVGTVFREWSGEER